MREVTLAESCACGAHITITVDGLRETAVVNVVSAWRKEHKHAEAVGICGDQPPPIKVGNAELSWPYCVLKAGHSGMHAGDDGCNWTHRKEGHDA